MRTITVVTSLYSSGPLVTNPSQAADMNNVAVPSIPNSLGMYPIHCDGIVVNPLERIGAGGSGTVYRSVVIDSESPTLRPKDSVVVKVSNPGTDNRLENECSILRHLTSLDAPGFER